MKIIIGKWKNEKLYEKFIVEFFFRIEIGNNSYGN